MNKAAAMKRPVKRLPTKKKKKKKLAEHRQRKKTAEYYGDEALDLTEDMDETREIKKRGKEEEKWDLYFYF